MYQFQRICVCIVVDLPFKHSLCAERLPTECMCVSFFFFEMIKMKPIQFLGPQIKTYSLKLGMWCKKRKHHFLFLFFSLYDNSKMHKYSIFSLLASLHDEVGSMMILMQANGITGGKKKKVKKKPTSKALIHISMAKMI